MAELVFYYGPMGSSKTAHALMTHFQYKERGKKVWLIKPVIDTREPSRQAADGSHHQLLVKSRIGIEAWADAIKPKDPINPPIQTNVIICDEAQFLTASQVEDLKMIADTRGIQVFCYGLKTDFTSHLFEGSKRLFELASKVEEVPVICECGNTAVVNARFKDGHIMFEGEQIDIGGDDKYRAMCYACWQRKIAEELDDIYYSMNMKEIKDE
jgi:thymidine kinase